MTHSVPAGPTGTPFFVLFAAFILLGSLLSALYPAFILSSFNPAKILRRKIKSTRIISLKHGLIVFQFVVVIVLIAYTVMIHRQISFMRTIDLGFQKENILVVHAPRGDVNIWLSTFETFKHDLLNHSFINDITASQSVPGQKLGEGWGPIWRVGQDSKQGSVYQCAHVYPNFVNFYNIEMVAGRNFDKKHSSGDAYILI